MGPREVRSWKSKCVLERRADLRARRERVWASGEECSSDVKVRRARRMYWYDCLKHCQYGSKI